MIRTVYLIIALLGATAAVAQTAPQAAATPTGKPGTPTTTATASGDKLICERQEVLGSRLQGRRVCKTASEWAEDRRLERAEVDRIQTQRSCAGGC